MAQDRKTGKDTTHAQYAGVQVYLLLQLGDCAPTLLQVFLEICYHLKFPVPVSMRGGGQRVYSEDSDTYNTQWERGMQLQVAHDPHTPTPTHTHIQCTHPHTHPVHTPTHPLKSPCTHLHYPIPPPSHTNISLHATHSCSWSCRHFFFSSITSALIAGDFDGVELMEIPFSRGRESSPLWDCREGENMSRWRRTHTVLLGTSTISMVYVYAYTCVWLACGSA